MLKGVSKEIPIFEFHFPLYLVWDLKHFFSPHPPEYKIFCYVEGKIWWKLNEKNGIFLGHPLNYFSLMVS